MRVGPRTPSCVAEEEEDERPETEEEKIEGMVRRAVISSVSAQAQMLSRELLPLLNASLKEYIRECVEDAFHAHAEHASYAPHAPVRHSEMNGGPKGPPMHAFETNGQAKADGYTAIQEVEKDMTSSSMTSSTSTAPSPARLPTPGGAPAAQRPPSQEAKARLSCGDGDTGAAELTAEALAGQPWRAEQEKILEKFMHREVFGNKSSAGNFTLPEGNAKADSPREKWTFLLEPTSSFRFTWDMCLMFLIMFIAFELPYRLAFNFIESTPPGWVVYDFFVLTFFLSDIVINFRTGFISNAHHSFGSSARALVLPRS
jgi:hypothetical protein